MTIRLSKWMSYILRHSPHDAQLVLDLQGWVSLDDFKKAAQDKGFDPTEIETVVETSDKKRFEIRDGMIRASQGHSQPVELGYKASLPPRYLYHGTTEEAAHAILRSGIRKGQRHHVHLSVDVETARIVGSRRAGKTVIFKVCAKDMANDGIEFYQSQNGVWLTNYVHRIYVEVMP